MPDCYAVVVPDKVAAGSESAAMSYEWLDILWDKFGDVPFYFVLQDGMDAADMRQALYDPRIHGLFLGGTLEYKLTEGRALRGLAHSHNKMFHYGGASTEEKIRHALAIHSDSLDSAFWLIKKSARDVAIGLRPQSAASIEELSSDADKKRVAEVRWILNHPDLTRQHATSVYAGTTTAPYDVWRNKPSARWTVDADKAKHDLRLIDVGLLDWSADNPTEVVVGQSVDESHEWQHPISAIEMIPLHEYSQVLNGWIPPNSWPHARTMYDEGLLSQVHVQGRFASHGVEDGVYRI